MRPETPLKVVLCWHMHQPDYRDHLRGEFVLPWVYLHAIKDYVDMAAHLEAVPGARAVVNFSPILLEQLRDYEMQLQGYLQNGTAIRDPLLAMLDSAVMPGDAEHRMALIKACLRSNRKHQIDRFPAYKRLVELADHIITGPGLNTYLSDQYLADLVTWYHLAWLGEIVRRSDTRVAGLIRQGSGFTIHQRRMLLELVHELISGLRSRYKSLSDSGQVELSMSPHAHPMLPLLMQFTDARDAMPGVQLPLLPCYPGGEQRAYWHLQHGMEVFEEYFGERPTGCWPSEGGVSAMTAKLAADAGFKWIATGENVLRNSINGSGKAEKITNIFHAFQLQENRINLYARDDTLSDLIGFTYADWHADDAVGDLVHRLDTIAGHCHDRENTVVSIIMDGENAWEYYPENAYYFISALYQRLSEHPRITLTTYRDLQHIQPLTLDRLVAGSWVYGTFSTWIGDKDKNRAWDILGEIKRAYDECYPGLETGKRKQIDAQLAACEGSDWFWWFGDYNPAATVSDFEHLYRVHIGNLYHMLRLEPPEYLAHSLSHGSGDPALGGVIRPGNA